MNGKNGDNPRLDRIEGIIEALANRQNLIEDEFSRLLKAQVVMVDHMNKLTEAHGKLTEAHGKLTESQRELTEIQRQIAAAHEERMRDADDRLNALIKIVDDLVRRPPGALPA